MTDTSVKERIKNELVSRLEINDPSFVDEMLDIVFDELAEPSERLIMEGQHPPIVGHGFFTAQGMILRWQRMIQHIRDGGS